MRERSSGGVFHGNTFAIARPAVYAYGAGCNVSFERTVVQVTVVLAP